ncbi:helix-turn-helix domain-containing protein [Sphingomonas hankookensis]|uniref:helix-turn-helix domain-containing protein n=1 Tax=Sphingomonas hankookensis TaxID=563996 RepID=UPI00234FB4A8|nr:helix-turn-helix domain-containing protein [Sphingomonas hankookensis]WCP73968.1 helix-turn-helix domain-containing protein [Sphingomonas hankookensis]
MMALILAQAVARIGALDKGARIGALDGAHSGAAAAKPATRSGGVHRTGAPVRRGSVEAGTVEDSFFAVPAKGETDRLLRAARAALDAGRRVRRTARAEGRMLDAAEAALAGLTAGAVRVFEEICTLARLNGGKVFPTYDHLARATALGRATVARALAALEAAGFLLRQRRFCRTTGEGPRYRQTSNLYRALLPGKLLRFLPRSLRPAPLPCDAAVHQAEAAAELAAMRATLSCKELAEVTLGGALGRVLASLGAAIDRAACESHCDPQPLPESLDQTTNVVGLAGRRRPA